MLNQISAFDSVFSDLDWDVTTPIVTQTLNTDELCELVPHHDGWIIGDDPANAKVVAAACALNQHNHHMLNAEIFSRCKPGVKIVNVARGPLIDERSLESALATGIVSGCALDVFEEEPLPMTSQLRQYPQNIFGSHNGSNTTEVVYRTSRRANNLLEDFLVG